MKCYRFWMPIVAPNDREILKAINGPRIVYSVAKHPGLYLATTGQGAASWRIKYRPRGAKHQRWHTLTNDARGVKFAQIADRARALLASLKLDGIDPRAELERPAGLTIDALFADYIERHSKPKKRTWKHDVSVYGAHISGRIGNRPANDITRREVIVALARFIHPTCAATR